MIRWPADLAAAARRFRSAKPFAHLVLDRVLAPADLGRIAAAFAEEPMAQVEDEIYLHLRSSEPPMSAPLRELFLSLQASCPQVSRICGRRLSRADGSAYLYLEGHYLLPHSDSRVSEGRAIAYAYYALAPEKGGELELFSRTRAARRIAARANRLVLFEVNDLALHQVREVLAGARASMAGWFYP